MSYHLKFRGGYPEAIVGFVIAVAIARLMSTPAVAAPVEVRFLEGATHGYLLVQSLAGETIGQGEMTQVIGEGDLVENRLVFRFKDGSLHDENVAFSQQGVFTLMSYRLVQRGPSFPEQLDASIDRGTTEYTVRSKTRVQEKVARPAGRDSRRYLWTRLSPLNGPKAADGWTRYWH